MLSKNFIIGIVFLSVAILAGLIAMIVYLTSPTKKISVSPTNTPIITPTPEERITLASPNFTLVSYSNIQTFVEPDIVCVPPDVLPSYTAPNENLIYPLKPGRFATNQTQSVIIAVGNMTGDLIYYCRQIYFLNVNVTKDGTTLDILGDPINYGSKPGDNNFNSPWDLQGIVGDRINLIAMQDTQNPNFAFITSYNRDTNIEGILVFSNLSGSWDMYTDDDSNQVVINLNGGSGIAGVPFGNTIYYKNDYLFAQTETESGFSVQVFKLEDGNFTFIQDISMDSKTDSFGYSIQATKLSSSGITINDQLFISAYTADVNGILSTGIIYSYQFNGTVYSLIPASTITGSQENDFFGKSLFVSDDGLTLVCSKQNSFVNAYHRISIVNNFSLIQTIDYPILTGSTDFTTTFGSQIKGTSDGRLITISATSDGTDLSSSYNKLYCYTQNETDYSFNITSLQPQIMGNGYTYGLFSDVQLIGTDVQLLVGDTSNGTISLMSYEGI
jgi:hypothetical protein